MDASKLKSFVGTLWDDAVVPSLTEYIRIPNKSPTFDPHWERNGHMEAAINLMADWCRAQPIAGMRIEVAYIDAVPLSVDTPDDLERARRLLS